MTELANSTSTPEASSRRLARGTLAVGCLAVFLAQFAVAISTTLTGLFQADLHATGSQITWILDASLLPVAVLELTFGVLGDLFGRKRLLTGGALVLAAGEAISVSGGLHLLWAGQAVAGVGAAAIFPSSLAMIAAVTHTIRQRAMAIAIWAAALSSGAFAATLVGGLSGAHGSWRTAFVVVAIAGVIAAALSQTARESGAPGNRSLDIGGQITIAVGMVALLFAVIQGPADGWGSAPVIAGFATAAVFLALFGFAETRSRSPLLHLNLFRNRSFTIAAAAATIGMLSFLGACYAITIRLGAVQHQSTLRIAAAFLTVNAWPVVLIPVTAALLARIPARWLLSVSFLMMACGDLLVARIPITDTALPSLILPLALIGIGFAFAVSSITATAVNTVPVHLAGMASGATTQLRHFGFTLGPAIIGAVALSRAGAAFSSALGASSLPPALKAAVGHIEAADGPLAVNSLPPRTPLGKAAPLALQALGHGYSIGFVVCACAAGVSCLLAAVMLRSSHADLAVGEADAEVALPPASATA
jgi:MFS family permease